ncbi:twitch domain-containing radical SAM protein [Acidobacteriota bacterium]
MRLDQKILSEYNKTRKTENTEVFCHAPFSSMYFLQNGNVAVCCYNRTNILGKYPLNTLEKIWFGTEADKIRDCLGRNDLPLGCEICRSQFQSRNFSGLRAQFFDNMPKETCSAEKGKFISLPKVLEFEISNVCNLECSMCIGYFSSSIRKNREHLPSIKNPYDDMFVKQLETFIPHLKEARFVGGEPFLIDLYYQIWDLIIRLNPDIQVSITTNGTILNKRVKNTLEGLRAHIILSIDSFEKENYERIRINAQFDQVMENFLFFKDYVKRKSTLMTIAVCPIRQNWKELPQLLKFCNEHGVQVFFNTVIYPKDAALNSMNKEDLSKITEYLGSIELKENSEIHKYNNSKYRDLIQQIACSQDKAFDFEGYIAEVFSSFD